MKIWAYRESILPGLASPWVPTAMEQGCGAARHTCGPGLSLTMEPTQPAVLPVHARRGDRGGLTRFLAKVSSAFNGEEAKKGRGRKNRRGGEAGGMISKGEGKKHGRRIMRQRGSVVYFYEENSHARRQDGP